ncbi:MAG: hypothetical protein OIF47_03000, partial [Marinibacterium sp.]|nr:hypothetical protein [Marinibacterium sp.]
LALDLAPGFDAGIGDEFVILTATGGVTGQFNAFRGFDLGGGKAFELVARDANTLVLRVTTDTAAEAGGFINQPAYMPPARPVPGKTDLVIDTLAGPLADVNVTGRASGAGLPDVANATLSNVTLTSDVAGQTGNSDISVLLRQGLELAGSTLSLTGTRNGGEFQLYFEGAQQVQGNGILEFLPDAGGSTMHRLTLRSELTGAEHLVFGPDITLRGHVDVSANAPAGGDGVQILGRVEGLAGALLHLGHLDNDGATVTVD